MSVGYGVHVQIYNGVIFVTVSMKAGNHTFQIAEVCPTLMFCFFFSDGCK